MPIPLSAALQRIKERWFREKAGLELPNGLPSYDAPRCVPGQMNCDEKSNEISACPQLVDSLKISGAVITTDAMMCQKAIAKKQCDYVLALKKNHPTMHQKVKDIFECRRECSTQHTETFDIGHGRREKGYTHWVLDVMFLDDDCSVLDKNIAENPAIIRRIVYNRIKMFSDFETLSMHRRGCMFDDDFRLRIFFFC